MVTKRRAFTLRELGLSASTAQQYSEVSLLQLLICHKAPLGLFKAVQFWAQDSALLGHDFNHPPRGCVRVLQQLEERFDMVSSRFQPKVVSYLPDKRPTVVYVTSFADAVYSFYCPIRKLLLKITLASRTQKTLLFPTQKTLDYVPMK
jgi:hypothetical protein